MKILLLLLLTLQLFSYDFSHKAYQNTFPEGQCTWFVDGIVKEKLNINLKFSQGWGRHAKHWPELLNMKLHKEPRKNSIAVYDWRKHGHVMFIEDIYDDTYIIFREANNNGNNKIDRYDGRLQMRHKDRHRMNLRGYLYL